jgi:peroxiredoxin
VFRTLVILAALAFVSPLVSAESLIKEVDRKRAPEFELPDADGKITRLSDYQGNVVLVDFWATWCIPCKTEIPWFNDFEQKYKNQGFAVLGISRDEDGWTKVKPFIERMRMGYRILLGDARTAYKYGDVDALPVAFLLDRERRVAAIHFGLVSRKKVEEEIRTLLEASSESK